MSDFLLYQRAHVSMTKFTGANLAVTGQQHKSQTAKSFSYSKKKIEMSQGNNDCPVSSRTRQKGQSKFLSLDLNPKRKRRAAIAPPNSSCQQNLDNADKTESNERIIKTVQSNIEGNSSGSIIVINVEDTTSSANLNQQTSQINSSQIDKSKQTNKSRNNDTAFVYCDENKNDKKKLNTGSVKRKLETKSCSSRPKRRRNNENMNKEIVIKEKEEFITISVDLIPQGSESDNHCTICLENIEDKKTLEKCKHSFCRSCIDEYFKKMNPICPICGFIYGAITGNQPINGTMNTYTQSDFDLPGYESYGVIVINYSFPDGIQTEEHPYPGERYDGTYRIAYLPNNQEGQHVCQLLRRAFDARLTFTVGRSATTGLENQITWNDIHHKTRPNGGIFSFGYPDETYLSRVKLELRSKGIR